MLILLDSVASSLLLELSVKELVKNVSEKYGSKVSVILLSEGWAWLPHASSKCLLRRRSVVGRTLSSSTWMSSICPTSSECIQGREPIGGRGGGGGNVRWDQGTVPPFLKYYNSGRYLVSKALPFARFSYDTQLFIDSIITKVIWLGENRELDDPEIHVSSSSFVGIQFNMSDLGRIALSWFLRARV